MLQPAASPVSRLRFWVLAFVGFLLFLFLIRAVLLPFVVGMLTAYFLDPAADRLEKWGFSRGLATATITVAFFSTIALLLVLLVPAVLEQFSGLMLALPDYVTSWQQQLEPTLQEYKSLIGPEQLQSLRAAISNISGTVLGAVGDFAGGLLQSGFAIINLFSLLFITPVVAFYLLKDWDDIVARIDDLLPRPHAETIRTQLRIIDATISGFVHGQSNVCLFLATFYAVLLSLAGLNFGLVIGVLTGILAILPYVGVLFGFLLAMGVAFFQYNGNVTDIGIIAAIFGVGQFIEGNFVTPRLVGEKVGLHPVWIIFGMLAGASLFGFVGVLIAVPVTAIIGVLVRFAAAHYRQSALYYGDAPPPLPVAPAAPDVIIAASEDKGSPA